jgi:hypothetical protein
MHELMLNEPSLIEFNFRAPSRPRQDAAVCVNTGFPHGKVETSQC